MVSKLLCSEVVHLLKFTKVTLQVSQIVNCYVDFRVPSGLHYCEHIAFQPCVHRYWRPYAVPLPWSWLARVKNIIFIIRTRVTSQLRAQQLQIPSRLIECLFYTYTLMVVQLTFILRAYSAYIYIKRTAL